MQLNATTREITGKASRKLRHQGSLPAVVYGHHSKPGTLALSAHDFDRVYARAGRTQLLDLVVDGGRPHKVLIKAVQLSPRRNTPIHVDFHQVSMREKLQIEVPIALYGEPAIVTTGDGEILQTLHALKVECLPSAIPETIEVDISHLQGIDAGIRVSELRLPDGVTATVDAEELVVKIQPRRDLGAVLDEEEAVAAAESVEAAEPAAADAAEGEQETPPGSE